jgi:cellulose synthase/poly-beta-1,6-N-acetylglucosamine synthase-like glycosyltransferase
MGQATYKSKEQAPSVSVVICTRRRPNLLQKCLAAVSRLNPAANQVLVVDNSEGDEDTRKTALAYGARYTLEPVRGLSRARNRGIAECDTDIVAFLDDDVIPAPDWLGLLLLPFKDEQTGATAGRIITPDSQNPGELEQSPRTLSNQDAHWIEIATFGGLGLGANMAFRKRALPVKRFFDERLGRGAPFEIGEESYAFAWLLSRGYRVATLPSAVVYHPPLSRTSIEREARNSFAYWLLLLAEFPGQRLNLLDFLIRRLRGKSIDWPRNPQEPGEIVSSSWRILFLAGIKGLLLFIRTPKHR